jgi:light-regulated signal transduction histidine kinase (bacteriophytochrome)
LAASAQAISRDGDYSVRVPADRYDELGTLARSFNRMLEQIEHRDAELAASRDVLEQRVIERTRELELEVAERRAAQAALTEQTEQLTRSNADLEQFAYVASHDLQEPLRMVASYTQLLAQSQQDRLGKDAKEYIGYAIDGATRMQNLISDLLRYSRLASEPTPLVALSPQDVLAAACKNLEVAARESGATITADPLPTVRGNKSQLVQLFQNLIGNALKFRGERPPIVHVSAAPRPDGCVEFSVQDNGVGFDPKYAAKIFIIFQRLHARGKYPGTGIGLAVCKKIVERHGGTIWVDSTPGVGTTFHFTLPQDDVATSACEEEVHDGG